ncbi:hypothetical protein [Bradyrhizobium sp. USDA 3256]
MHSSRSTFRTNEYRHASELRQRYSAGHASRVATGSLATDVKISAPTSDIAVSNEAVVPWGERKLDDDQREREREQEGGNEAARFLLELPGGVCVVDRLTGRKRLGEVLQSRAHRKWLIAYGTVLFSGWATVAIGRIMLLLVRISWVRSCAVVRRSF